MSDRPELTQEERAAKREAAIQGMVDKGYSRERAERAIGIVAKTLFGPGGRFADPDRSHWGDVEQTEQHDGTPGECAIPHCEAPRPGGAST